LIFCSARSIDHVDDLNPASFFSSVRLVSSWMTVISSCSRSNHRFREKNVSAARDCPPSVRLHACSVSPSVVLILVLPRSSSQSNAGDSAGILTYPPFGCDSAFPLHPLFHPCWTILVGRISSVKWTGVQTFALRPGVIILAPFQI